LRSPLPGLPDLRRRRADPEFVHRPIAGGLVFFVVATSLHHGLLSPKFPKFFKNSYCHYSSMHACRSRKNFRSGARSRSYRCNW
jgi:hypothetical protein